MKTQGKKILAGLTVLLMVLCIIPSGAVDNETATDSNSTDMLPPEDNFRGRGPMIPGPMGPGNEAEMQEFETEEEELEFFKARTIESIEKRIEMLENFDETADENITAESVDEEISELEALIEEVNNASTLDEVKEITAEMMRPGNGKMMKGHGIEKPGFETEDEEIEFVKERTTESVDRMIGILENIDLEDSGEITSDDIGSMISQLEDINIILDDEDLTLDELEEMKESIFQIMETVRELMPAPENDGKGMPHHRGPIEETGEN